MARKAINESCTRYLQTAMKIERFLIILYNELKKEHAEIYSMGGLS